MAQSHQTDNRWEYDAPLYLVDFNELDRADADHWFEQLRSGSDAELASPLSCGASKGIVPKAICPYVEAEVDPEPSTDATPPSNIITSCAQRPSPNRKGAHGPAARTDPSVQPRRKTTRPTTRPGPGPGPSAGTSANHEAAGLQCIHRAGSHNATREALRAREAYVSYFNNEGAVGWQPGV
ncbi:unnamed protein product [Arctogadus glacialis]